MTIPFTKMQGLGNDYVYVDLVNEGNLVNEVNQPNQLNTQLSTLNFFQLSTLNSQLLTTLCDRHFGIGSDGVVLILPSEAADFKMRIFNADGSEAEMCGNAARCVGKYVYEHGLTDKTNLTLETLAGIKQIVLHIKEDKVASVSVNMGKPVCVVNEVNQPNQPNQLINPINFINIGNPHAVVFVEEPLDNYPVAEQGRAIETSVDGGINVEFVRVINDHELQMRVWERGSGETMACGTGACAAVVAGVVNKGMKRDAVVHLRGGDLNIHWDKTTDEIWQTGPAIEVFHGEIEI